MCRHLEIAGSTWHRWLAQYGGMKAKGAKRLKELEGENARLKMLLDEAELDKAMLKESRSPPASAASSKAPARTDVHQSQARCSVARRLVASRSGPGVGSADDAVPQVGRRRGGEDLDHLEVDVVAAQVTEHRVPGLNRTGRRVRRSRRAAPAPGTAGPGRGRP